MTLERAATPSRNGRVARPAVHSASRARGLSGAPGAAATLVAMKKLLLLVVIVALATIAAKKVRAS
jgi:hypothetical protein